MRRLQTITPVTCLAVCCAGALWSAPANAQVTCERFRLLTTVKGEDLKLSVDTDLPDDTVLSVSVSRSYQEKGDTTSYSCDYFSEKSTVGVWRTPRKISLAEKPWRAALRAKQVEMSRLGLGFQVGAISNAVRARMVVPLGQKNPRFGAKNANLTGRAVATKGVRVVTAEKSFNLPLGAQSPMPALPSLDPRNLDVGGAYVVSRETPLMPELDPEDPIAALRRMKQIPKGGAFKILGVAKRASSPWYRVAAIDNKGGKIGAGWINSTALVGQELKPRR